MTDVSGREIGNRSIVLCLADDYGLQFGVVDDTNQEDETANVIVVFENGNEYPICIENAPGNLFLVAQRQLPNSVREQLIKLSEFRAKGPGDLRDTRHLKQESSTES